MARRASVGDSGIGSAIVGVDRRRAPPARSGRGPSHTIWMSPNDVRLVEVDEALLEQLEDGEEAHDHLEALDEVAGELAERDRADERAAPRAARRTASLTDARIGATWSRSIRGTGFGVTARRKARLQLVGA